MINKDKRYYILLSVI